MNTEPVILGIDTSCDDTSVGIVRGARVLSNVITSQDDIHKGWGGVVPNLARRAHQENFGRVLQLSLQRAQFALEDIDAIAVTYGPGLAVSLEVGIEKAKHLAQLHDIPLIAVNHMEGHLLSPLAATRTGSAALRFSELQFPALGLLISGGHTEIVLVKSIGEYEILGETVDDAFGEAFDKVARMLGFGFPGGAVLSKFAQEGDPRKYHLPIPMKGSKDLNVSYSGLKTAVRRLIQEVSGGQPELLTREQSVDIAAVFQKVAVEAIVHKVRKALEQHQVKHLLVGGGAAANTVLRLQLRSVAKMFGTTVYFPQNRKLCSDNGAMIALVGAQKFLKNEFVTTMENLDREPQLSLNQNEKPFF